MTEYFVQAAIYLCAAVISVPIAKRLGLGSVLGYLLAGVIIGPMTGLVGSETNTIQHFAEFGVVMMLFLVGLELEPKALWQMRSRLLGLGGLQVSITTLVVMGIALLLSIPWQVSLAIGLVLALSSTAIVLQTFNEKGLTKTEGGRNAFSVLLFQDIAVIPMLALLPLLASTELIEAAKTIQDTAEHGGHPSLVSNLPTWLYAIVIVASISALTLGGHFLSRPLFRFIADTGLREMFVATALLLVIGIAAFMGLIGLSPALGTFLAGVVLANSEFRHELETNIEPFKGLLLGLFFITVGAGIDFTIIAEQWQLIIGFTLLLIGAKAGILYALASMFGVKHSARWLLCLSLAQAGEFGFVLLSFTVQSHVIPSAIAQILQPIIAISMLLTPALFIIFDKLILPKYGKKINKKEVDTIGEQGKVIIAGVGRFGQIVNRLLTSNNITTVVLDHEASQIDRMRKIKIKSYFGNANRIDLLQAAGVKNAALFVVAIDDREAAVNLVRELKASQPKLRILARAFDRAHSYQLRDAGADYVQTETYYSALDVGAQALRELGFHPFLVEQKKNTLVREDVGATDLLYQKWKYGHQGESVDQQYRDIFIELEDTIREAMGRDILQNHSRGERGWTPPPKGYNDPIEK